MILAFIKSFFSRGGKETTSPESLERLDDQALMARYVRGDERAFVLLVNRHQMGLYNFILRSCRRRDTAEELLQEVFLRVVKSADRYEPTAKFSTWVYRIARNLCIDEARKRGATSVYSLQKPVGEEDGEGETHQDRLVDERARSGAVDADRGEFMDQLQQALERLPEDQREVFLLREISGLKFREIAEMLEVGVPTVKSRMRYALKTLRGELAAYREHEFDAVEKLEMMP